MKRLDNDMQLVREAKQAIRQAGNLQAAFLAVPADRQDLRGMLHHMATVSRQPPPKAKRSRRIRIDSVEDAIRMRTWQKIRAGERL